jgi:antitoxin ParD1/3/4
MTEMSITYPPDIEATINKLVESGRYSDPIDALREAVRLLEERERQREELIAKLQVGIDQADRGEVDEWTPELRDRLIREADEMYLRGEEPDPDVLP